MHHPLREESLKLKVRRNGSRERPGGTHTFIWVRRNVKYEVSSHKASIITYIIYLTFVAF